MKRSCLLSPPNSKAYFPSNVFLKKTRKRASRFGTPTHSSTITICRVHLTIQTRCRQHFLNHFKMIKNHFIKEVIFNYNIGSKKFSLKAKLKKKFFFKFINLILQLKCFNYCIKRYKYSIIIRKIVFLTNHFICINFSY